MNILYAAAIGAAIPWLFTLIWSFIYWDFRGCWDARICARESVVCALIGIVLMVVSGGLKS